VADDCASQFGGTSQRNVDFAKQYGRDLRLTNFTATEMRNSKCIGCDLRGTYFIKAVAPDSDFSGSDFSDALMDRAVFGALPDGLHRAVAASHRLQ
jgi:uncharacterized protein YjbI with pentapeptide repeats